MALLAAIPAALASFLPEASAFAGAAATGAATTAAGVTTAAAGAGAGSLLSTLSTAGTVAGLAGSALSGVSAITSANNAKNVANAENQQLEAKANQDEAAAERQQVQQTRSTQLALSRVQALAAASGGGATDPTVLNVEGQIAKQGSYNALSALYGGEAAGAADLYQGEIDLFQADRQQAAAPFQALGSVLSGISSLANNRAMMRFYANPAVG